MGREIRRVPPNWQHPVYTENETNDPRKLGEFIPMCDQTFKDAVEEWKAGFLEWENGKRPSCVSDDCEFWEWEGMPPEPEQYRPEFKEKPTWLQVYETVSEGTPCSPPFETKEELVNYLMTEGGLHRKEYPDLFPLLTREQAENFVNSEWAPSLVVEDGKVIQGIQAI